MKKAKVKNHMFKCSVKHKHEGSYLILYYPILVCRIDIKAKKSLKQ